MKPRAGHGFHAWRSAAVGLLCCALLTAPAAPAAESQNAAAAASAPAVLLELFTSQGCSSCPPADRLLSSLGSMPELQTQVFALAFHVDYWNQLGWKDPFSQHRWSERQQSYTRAGWSGRVYTPQMVIQGQAECVGSDREAVLAAIARARSQAPAARLELAAEWDQRQPERLAVRLKARMLRDLKRGELQAFAAVFENGLITGVGSGENARRTLRNDYVVRRLDALFAIDPKAGGEREAVKVVGLAPDWNLRQLGIAAFLQDSETLQIHAAASSMLAP